MLGALAVLAIGYRYYSAFLAAKVLCLNDARTTPAHAQKDGINFHPTSKWVLFGHHFAAITGAGPLIGPVLAAQFGFYPGFLWILFGVVLGGAVHDFVILVASTRRGGRSLAEIAKDELGPTLTRMSSCDGRKLCSTPMTSTSNFSGSVPLKTVSPYPFIPSLISDTPIVRAFASPRATGIVSPSPNASPAKIAPM